ncbi:IS701 family transposase [Streptomyces sp. NPDC021225]|uniref:IS701 family transposase n=1 Tax=Streptomyces sp. NPDC021225 TaxID=3365121 RepID=UPI0037B81E02
MKDITPDLCAALFTGFRRYDQRIRARQYVDGLLSAPGRKSIANIAAAVGGPGDEQRLHHFVSDSRWNWDPLRSALTRTLEQRARSAVWVVRPVSIPKAGEHSVGVGRHFSADAEHVVNGQQAYGIWFASREAAVPVSWRMRLTGRWGRERSSGDEGVSGLLADVRRWGDPRRPVLLDVGDVPEAPALVSRHLREGCPLAVRIGGGLPLTPVRPTVAGAGRRAVPARRILATARRLRATPVTGGRGPGSVVTARVRLPGVGLAQEPLVLFGVWDGTAVAGSPPGPSEVWLTNMGTVSPGALWSLTRLPHRVAEGWRTRGAAVGLRDFEGRSLAGWHRHMTLASCAYTILSLRAAAPSSPSLAPPVAPVSRVRSAA